MNDYNTKKSSSNVTSSELEYFDVVNQHDEVINQLPRDEVHEKGLLHRAVHGLISKADGSAILIQKRAADKQHEPNCWDTSVGGHVSAGETYNQAIYRETEEEMGLVLDNDQAVPIFKLLLDEGVPDEFVWVYLIYTDEPISPCQREVADIQWLTPEAFIDFVINEKEPCSVTLSSIVEKLLSTNYFNH